MKGRKAVLPDVSIGTHDILCIGWSPGAEEIKAGRPFVGPSGKLLRGWLKRAGVIDRVGFANVCLYRAPEGNRKPSPQEIAGCAPILVRLIENMKPKLIICLGDVPARMFGFKGSVGSMVGRFKIESGLPAAGNPLVTVLYHPAYGIRLKGSKRFAEVEAQTLEVINEAVYRVSGEREVEQYPWVHVNPVLLIGKKPTAIDTESQGERDARLTEMISVQSYDGLGSVMIGPSLMAGPHHPLLFHNAIHDLIVLARHGSKQEVVVGDTMVAAWMLGRPNLSLKGLSWRELGANVIDYEEAHAAGGDVWTNYEAQDPVLTYQLHEKLYPELVFTGMSWLYDNVEMPLQPILAESSMLGLDVDHAKVMSLWSAMDRRMELLEQRMTHIAGADFNPNSPKKVLNYLRERGHRIKDTGTKTLTPLIQDEFIQYLLSYRKAQRRISTYLIPLSQMSKVSGMFNPTGTGPGRLSQSKRNIQNFPADIKGCIKAPEGYVFVYRDYSQIQMRLAAFHSMDEYLLGALREGRNMHEELCLAVFGYRVPELYTKSKSANFEHIFGGSRKTRAEALGVPEYTLARVEPPWPGYDGWAASQRQRARATGEAHTYLGRRLLLSGIESADPYLRDKAEREAIVMPAQGGEADICKYAMVLAQPHVKQLGGRVAHQEHDSILAIAPQSYAQEVDRALDEAMTEAVPEDIRKVIDIPSKSIISTHWG